MDNPILYPRTTAKNKLYNIIENILYNSMVNTDLESNLYSENIFIIDNNKKNNTLKQI